MSLTPPVAHALGRFSADQSNLAGLSVLSGMPGLIPEQPYANDAGGGDIPPNSAVPPRSSVLLAPVLTARNTTVPLLVVVRVTPRLPHQFHPRLQESRVRILLGAQTAVRPIPLTVVSVIFGVIALTVTGSKLATTRYVLLHAHAPPFLTNPQQAEADRK